MPKKDKGSSPAKAIQLDMTNVKDGGGRFNKRRQPEGDYRAKILKVETVAKKSDKNVSMWLWTIEAGTGTYPYYTGFEDNVLWKIRNLFAAAGVAVPKKRVKVDPNKIVGREIAVTLMDDEYDGRAQSVIDAVFPTSELSGDEPESDDDEDDDEDEDDVDDSDDEESDDDDEDEDDEEEDSDDDEDDDEDSDEDDDEEEEDEEEEPEPEPVKKKAKKGKAKPAAKRGKKKKSSDDVDDDELEELSIEDI